MAVVQRPVAAARRRPLRVHERGGGVAEANAADRDVGRRPLLRPGDGSGL